MQLQMPPDAHRHFSCTRFGAARWSRDRATGRLDRLQCALRRGRRMDADRVAGTNGAGGDDDGHNAGSAMDGADGRAAVDGCLEAGLEVIDELAGCAEAGELDNGDEAEVEAGGEGKGEEVEAGGGNVFTELAGLEQEVWGEVGKELGLEEVDLGVIKPGRIFADMVAVLDGAAGMRVALNA